MIKKNTGRKYLLYQMFQPIIARALIGGGLPSVEELQNKYAFTYYSTMTNAVTDVNNGTTANADATKDSAVAGVYTDENGGKNVVLLKDHTEATRIEPYVDMTINLGGNALSSDDSVCIDIYSGNVTIDGRLTGSTVTAMSDISNPRAIQARSGKIKIDGGTYIASTNTATLTAISILSGGDLTVLNAVVDAFSANDGKSIGITNVNMGTATVTNCNIRAYSDYTYGSDGYDRASNGVQNSGDTLTLNDCYVMGTHSGVQNYGSLYVNGGTYEGYGHGGFYFTGTDQVSYVRNAVIRDCEMPEGYTATASRNGAGMYISGTNVVNQSVYMDNCDISGKSQTQTIAIASSSGAQNSTLYISNSSIHNMDGGIGRVRIDDDTHKLYLGVGNNFTADDTNRPEAVVVTDEVYVCNAV